jgi:hypothetical protein
MKKKEDCSWCKSTSDIERTTSHYMPEEYRYRCSACHEAFWEDHAVCDFCDSVFSFEERAEALGITIMNKIYENIPPWEEDVQYACQHCIIGTFSLSEESYNRIISKIREHTS